MSDNVPTASSITDGALDAVLVCQLAVAWAGEGGEDARLKWWATDLVSEFGGRDLFRLLLPHTAEWAVFEGAREAARRTDSELRSKDANPDRLMTLYSFGFDIDERLDERLADLKRRTASPLDALAGLRDVVASRWNKDSFSAWMTQLGHADAVSAPAGRRLKGEPPREIDQAARMLVAALHPLAPAYPLPHYRKPT
ncbi:MAG: BREX-6 system BrxE protein [Deltaproteobacteria bacterium]|nr:BREX-6 system BrxE protein [Deltaproteobacteria bacterium]